MGLVFSTQTARPKESAAKSIMDLPQEVSNAIYSVLFKVAPFLAGGQERRRQRILLVSRWPTNRRWTRRRAPSTTA